MTRATQPRVFLFLQGPHGPFFAQLARQLSAAGHKVLRAGFNAGDRAFWSDPASYVAIKNPIEAWPARFDALVAEHGVTDIVLYGDTRPVHALAKEQAYAAGICVHVFEEGYLRQIGRAHV